MSWETTKREIQQRSFKLRRRLLPGIDATGAPPPSWECWRAPDAPKDKPIDAVISDLINKSEPPRLRNRTELEADGVICPYWFARCGIVLAAEAADLAVAEADDSRKAYEASKSELKWLTTSDLIEQLKRVARLQRALDLGVRLIPESAYAEAAWRGDDFLKRLVAATNAFSDHAEPLAQALLEYAALARFILDAAGKLSCAPAYAAPRLRFRAREQGCRYPQPAGLSRPQEHPAYRPLH